MEQVYIPRMEKSKHYDLLIQQSKKKKVQGSYQEECEGVANDMEVRLRVLVRLLSFSS